MPQLLQNFDSEVIGLPQLGQNLLVPAGAGGPSGAGKLKPQLGQNFDEADTSEPQFGQLLWFIPWPIPWAI